MKELILIKNGELALKGLNRGSFEDTLIQNMKRRLSPIGNFKFKKAQSTINVMPQSDDIDLDEAVEVLSKVFGIAVISRALIVEKDFEDIKLKSVDYLKDVLNNARTFKVDAKRADKNFPMKTPEICSEFGGFLLENFPHLTVDVRNPEVTVTVEIRDFCGYIHAKKIRGAGGMPIGTSGNALLLVSGGIDSPVAGYMMAKRGLIVDSIHFVSPPYTSDRARQKVEDLCKKLCEYTGRMNFYCVNITEIQEKIKKHCDEELFTIILRRIMMEISLKVANEIGAGALITGESVAQVASQTIGAIACTDIISTIPVFRPVIGMDKQEIIEIAKKIDTFETSILPFEDCCTVFTPKHPRTKPKLELVEASQNKFDFAPLINEAIATIEKVTITL
jgi:thiamine biosynthesis protein ThiI